VALGAVKMMQLDIDVAGNVNAELKRRSATAPPELCDRTECTCSSSAASLVTRKVIG
jgi:hypothetical protein